MGYDLGDSFPFHFEPNRFPFGSKSKGKLSPRSHLIQFERKWKYSFLSVQRDTATVRETAVSRHSSVYSLKPLDTIELCCSRGFRGCAELDCVLDCELGRLWVGKTGVSCAEVGFMGFPRISVSWDLSDFLRVFGFS